MEVFIFPHGVSAQRRGREKGDGRYPPTITPKPLSALVFEVIVAFYSVVHEGREYLSREAFMRMFNVGETGLMRINRFVTLLDTVFVGPLSAEELNQIHDFGGYTRYNFDTFVASMEKANDKQETIHVAVAEHKVYSHKEMRFVRLSDIVHTAKYRMMSRMALVRLGGRTNMYVCLDHQIRGVNDALIVTRK